MKNTKKPEHHSRKYTIFSQKYTTYLQEMHNKSTLSIDRSNKPFHHSLTFG